MITSEIKVNGCLIGFIHIVNQDYTGTPKEMRLKGYRLYTYELFRPEGNNVKRGEIFHITANGFEKLLGLIWEDINK